MRDVIISGAGLGGLTLANGLLQKMADVRCRIFERDAAADARAQGYTIGLQFDGALGVLQELGMLADVTAFSVPCLRFHFLDPRGELLMCLRGNEGDKDVDLRTPRQHLRQRLLRDIPASWLHYGSRAVGYTTVDGKPALRLEDGRVEVADLVVACDGFNSPVRQQMLGDAPHLFGLVSIQARFSPALAHRLLPNGGPVMTVGDGRSMFAMNCHDITVWSVTFPGTAAELEGLDGPALRQRALRELTGWHPLAQQLIAAAPLESLNFRVVRDRDPAPRARDGAVVLLGDAAHPMVQFRGLGANTAMTDGLQLANLLVAHPNDWPRALAEYETNMLRRGRTNATVSRRSGKSFHNPSPLRGRLMRGYMRAVNRMMAPYFSAAHREERAWRAAGI